MQEIKITRIEVQKNRRNRYSLFSGETFLIGVSDATLLKFGLHTGISLSGKVLKQIEESENIHALKEQGQRLLARRPHSRKELQNKLLRKGHSQPEIDIVLDDFSQKNYIDDDDFTVQFIDEELRLKRSGPLVIKNKLAVRGIQPETITRELSLRYPESQQSENCIYHARKKIKNLVRFETSIQKSKLSAYLQQKGFPWRICKETIESLIHGDKDEII